MLVIFSELGKLIRVFATGTVCYKPLCFYIFFFRLLQFNFEGNYNLTKFIKMIGDLGMYATLRVGPFIEAEWNYGYGPG